MDAVSTRDFLLEALSASAILMVKLAASRGADPVVDVGVRLPRARRPLHLDELHHAPEEEPDTAELVRGKTGTVFGSLVAALAIVKALPMSYNRDLQEATPNLWRGISTTRGACGSWRGRSRRRSSIKSGLEAASGAGFSTATELADSLVRRTRIPFRNAHQIVGALAAKREVPTIRDLDEVAERIAGFRPSERGFGKKELEAALDPKENVAVRSRIGGPAPEETGRMVADRRKRIERRTAASSRR
jgi:argininosuccinate lyase